jgi:DNA modification methylase
VSTRTAKPILYGDRKRWGLVQADALDLLRQLPPHSADAALIDPPYSLDIAGHGWDGKDIRRAVANDGERLSAPEAFQRWTWGWALEAKRVLKPGAFIAVFGSPRTTHRAAAGLEDAGLELRDTLMWMYGTGVPKTRRLSEGTLGTALKPTYEPVLILRAPLQKGCSVETNLKAWGTGALNIDAARVPISGYWPANVALSHGQLCTSQRCQSDCPMALLGGATPPASRLLFCAKASAAEREAGCQELPVRSAQIYRGKGRPARIRANHHPTIKPSAVMRWLTRLLVPPGGLVLDPFAGSGSTGVAAMLEGRQFLGIEREREYVQVARARLTHWAAVAVQEEVLP